jgi:hypothetical protein
LALESATYIDTLNVSNPASSDYVSQADDHIRMLKSVLKSTFPNINAAVTSTPEQLNNGVVPVGGIIWWSGSAAAVPTGWKLCDGGTYTRSDGTGSVVAPDLRNKFILACGATTAAPTTAPTIGTTGGASTATPTITVTNEAIALTQAQLPSVNFTVTDAGHNHTATVTDPGHFHSYGINTNSVTSGGGSSQPSGTTGGNTNTKTTGITVANTAATTGITVASGGSNSTHIHNNTAVSSAVATVPPYYVLAAIIRI